MRVLRWAARMGLALVLLVATVWAIGTLLPVQHQATVSTVIPAPADSVWAKIGPVERWPTWRDVTVERLSDDRVRVRGRGEVLAYRIHQPAERTLVTEIDSPGLPFGGRWTWSVTPAGEGSSAVVLTEDGEVYDPFFRFFSRFVFGHESTLRDALGQLEASFEPSG